MNKEFEAWLDAVDYELEEWDKDRGQMPYRLDQWWDMWDHSITPEDAVAAAVVLLRDNFPASLLPLHDAYRTTLCHDCGIDTLPVECPDRAEYYMVTKELWDAHGCGYDLLCIGCLEVRMGRTLNASDFITDLPVNDLNICDTERYAWSYRTPRLVSRLMATN